MYNFSLYTVYTLYSQACLYILRKLLNSNAYMLLLRHNAPTWPRQILCIVQTITINKIIVTCNNNCINKHIENLNISVFHTGTIVCKREIYSLLLDWGVAETARWLEVLVILSGGGGPYVPLTANSFSQTQPANHCTTWNRTKNEERMFQQPVLWCQPG